MPPSPTTSDEEGSVADWQTLKEEGNEAFKASLFDEAIDAYGKAIDMQPEMAVLYSNRSAAHLKASHFGLAATDAQRAVELDKLFVKAYVRLHSALCCMGRFAEACEHLKAGLEHLSAANAAVADVQQLRELHSSAELASRAFSSAQDLVKQDRIQDAARLLGQPLRDFPECAPVAFLYAECTAHRDPDAVHKLLVGFGKDYGNDTHYLYLRALTLYYQGQSGFRNAQLLLRQVLAMDPDYSKAGALLKKMRITESHKEAGNSAFKQKNAAEAVGKYTTAIEVDPLNDRMNATLRANRAAAKMDLHDYKGALMDCDFAINHGCTSAKMYARRSRVHEQLEEMEDALRDMQQAVELDSAFEAELRQVKARAKRARRKNYYKTLDLPQGEADAGAIKRAYKKACLQWHPDKWAHASEEEKHHAEVQFKEVGEAFAVLSDPHKKQLYDSGRIDSEADSQTAGAGYASQEAQLAEMLSCMFGGGFGNVQFETGGMPRGFAARGRRPQSGMPRGFFNM